VLLPNAYLAEIDPQKLHGYLLSKTHPVGRFKARFFAALGYAAERLARTGSRPQDSTSHTGRATGRVAAGGASLQDSGYSEGTQRAIGGRAERVVRGCGWWGASLRHRLSGRRQVTVQPLDVVVLTHDVPTHGLRQGDLGTVVEIYGPNSIGVEFVAASGRTQALVTLHPTDFRPVADDDLVAVRPSGSADRRDG